MGVGMRGPGEKQLEVDRRLVEKRIHDLRAELKIVENRKQRQVASRRDHMTVSLVGYTNAGKSTLMNALTDANVVAADKLFATLDTRTRRRQLPSWGPVLLSDTVGFIRDLPHHLIASFKATLEETRQADLLLHVADASSPAVAQQISSVYGVLTELGMHEKDTLLLLNKIDQLESRSCLDSLLARYPGAIAISARTGEGFDQLADVVSVALSRFFQSVVVETAAPSVALFPGGQCARRGRAVVRGGRGRGPAAPQPDQRALNAAAMSTTAWPRNVSSRDSSIAVVLRAQRGSSNRPNRVMSGEARRGHAGRDTAITLQRSKRPQLIASTNGGN